MNRRRFAQVLIGSALVPAVPAIAVEQYPIGERIVALEARWRNAALSGNPAITPDMQITLQSCAADLHKIWLGESLTP